MSITLLSDEPAFKDSKVETENDVFGHVTLASVLHDVVVNNTSPQTIGLFGSWGIGKSSIVNALSSKLSRNDYVYAYFNAWKYSGDSFRRQFLIAFAEKLISDDVKRKEEVELLQKLNYAKVLDIRPGPTVAEIWNMKTSRTAFFRVINDFKSSLSNVVISDLGKARIVLSVLFFLAAIFCLARGFIAPDYELQRWGVYSIFLSAAGFFAPKSENIFVLKSNEVIDAKLIFPEQFSNKFDELIKRYSSDKKIVVVIDDLDRCDSQTIKEILVTLKNFLPHERCYFVVPIDDESVVEIFKGENKHFSYEQLRKYFTVSLRIPPLLMNDIVTFARQQAEKCEVEGDVAFIGAMGYCRDPRKMKHFINLYNLKLSLAEKRSANHMIGNLRLDDLDFKRQLAVICVLEYQYPEIYTFLLGAPQCYDKMVLAALDGGEPFESSQLKEIHIECDSMKSLWMMHKGLQEFFQSIPNVAIADFQTIATLKHSVPMQQVDEFARVLDQCISGSMSPSNAVNSIMKETLLDSRQTEVVDLIAEKFQSNILLIVERVYALGLEMLDKDLLQLSEEKRLYSNLVGVFVKQSDNRAIRSQPIYPLLNNLSWCTSTAIKSRLSQLIAESVFSNGRTSDLVDLVLHKSYPQMLYLNTDLSRNIEKRIADSCRQTILNRNERLEIELLTILRGAELDSSEQLLRGISLPPEEVVNVVLTQLANDNELGDELKLTVADLLLNRCNPTIILSYSERIGGIIVIWTANIVRLSSFTQLSVACVQLLELRDLILTSVAADDIVEHIEQRSKALDGADASRDESICKIFFFALKYVSKVGDTIFGIEFYYDLLDRVNVAALYNHLECYYSTDTGELDEVMAQRRTNIIRRQLQLVENNLFIYTDETERRVELLSLYRNAVREDDAMSFIERIIKSGTVRRDAWSACLGKVVDTFTEESQKTMCELLLSAVAQNTQNAETCECYLEMLIYRINYGQVSLKEAILGLLIQWLYSVDTVLVACACNVYRGSDSNVSDDVLRVSYEVCMNKILGASDYSRYIESIRLFQNLQVRYPDLTTDAFCGDICRKIAENINNEGTSESHRLALLEIGRMINRVVPTDVAEALSMNLRFVGANANSRDIRNAAVQLVNDLENRAFIERRS